jgi:hypothetical protein
MHIQYQDLELKESIKYLDANQKMTVLQYIKNQLTKKHRPIIKKEALKDIRAALLNKEF